MDPIVSSSTRGLTMSDHADITPCLIHASAFLPGIRDGVVTTDRVEVIASVEAADHVDQVV